MSSGIKTKGNTPCKGPAYKTMIKCALEEMNDTGGEGCTKLQILLYILRKFRPKGKVNSILTKLINVLEAGRRNGDFLSSVSCSRVTKKDIRKETKDGIPKKKAVFKLDNRKPLNSKERKLNTKEINFNKNESKLEAQKRKLLNVNVNKSPKNDPNVKETKMIRKYCKQNEKRVVVQSPKKVVKSKQDKLIKNKAREPPKNIEKEKGKKTRDKGTDQKKKEKKKAVDTQSPWMLKDPLTKICKAKKLTRHEVQRRIWAYIRIKKLQDPSKKTTIICDINLQKLTRSKIICQDALMRYLKPFMEPIK